MIAHLKHKIGCEYNYGFPCLLSQFMDHQPWWDVNAAVVPYAYFIVPVSCLLTQFIDHQTSWDMTAAVVPYVYFILIILRLRGYVSV